jgi:hypothetical protein
VQPEPENVTHSPPRAPGAYHGVNLSTFIVRIKKTRVEIDQNVLYDSMLATIFQDVF